MSSFGVVARVRRILSEQAGKKIKVGHTGTLDPFASGLMIIVVGDWCKRAGEFSKLDKPYETIACLGQTSSTQDPEGELTTVSKNVPTLREVETVLQAFRGTITQKPPAYSAIKINGQRAYQLARRGEVVDIPVRNVTIHELEILEYAYPSLKLRAHVSSGTYIRTLVSDIGQQLGVGAYCQALRRTSVGSFVIQNSLPLDSFIAKPVPPSII